MAAVSFGIVEDRFFTYAGIGGWSGIGPSTECTTELSIFYLPYAVAMNKAKYDSLPAEARAALDTECTAAKSVELAAAHLVGMAEPRATTEADGLIYVPTTDELNAWKDATATVKNDWAAYMTSLGFAGAGILARADEPIAEYEAS